MDAASLDDLAARQAAWELMVSLAIRTIIDVQPNPDLVRRAIDAAAAQLLAAAASSSAYDQALLAHARQCLPELTASLWTGGVAPPPSH